MKRTRLALVMALLALVIPSLGRAADAKAPRPGSDIIGGGPAGTGEYPFMAAILFEGAAGSDYDKQFCGGTLIAARWVLTAAHCVDGMSASEMAVTVGRTVLSSNQGQRRGVSAVFRHPQYGSPTENAHDAALLWLSSDVTGIAPIQLSGPANDGLEAAGTRLTIIGWGTTRAGKPAYPDGLREAVVPVVSDGTCKSAYGAALHEASEVCAGATGIDSCSGDSGGPLFAEGNPRIQVGIVTWGYGCAKKRFPGVYAEVNNAAIRSWITTTSGV